MKECAPYSWIKDDLPVVKAIMKGVLPEPKSRLLSPMNLWSVTRLCWKVNQQKRATASAVLKELKILMSTVETLGTYETTTPGSEVPLVTASEGGVDRQGAPQLKSLSILYLWASRAEKARRHYARFVNDRNRGDLDRAIGYQEEELQLRPLGHPVRSTSLYNMASYIHARYAEDKNRADLDAAIRYQEAVLQLQPPGHHDRSARTVRTWTQPSDIRRRCSNYNLQDTMVAPPVSSKWLFTYTNATKKTGTVWTSTQPPDIRRRCSNYDLQDTTIARPVSSKWLCTYTHATQKT
ncbi:hypothetical protein FRB94_006470 [Tulasnella sp. JGI-2019a]|nr:hypothetical protein FRB94_006470 [Tulasnella sp. JGI-2019a]